MDQLAIYVKNQPAKYCVNTNRDVLFEFHLKFWNTSSIGIPVRFLP